MAMGILAVFDMAGVDVGVNVHRSNADKYPPDPAYYQADFALHEAGPPGAEERQGLLPLRRALRASTIRKRSRSCASARATLGVPQCEHTEQEIVERCLYPLMNEGFRILEEGVAMRSSDIDVVWAAGYGFPRYRGGPMFYAETIGLKTLYDGMLKYQARFGPMHWQPAPLLAKLVSEGRTLAEWEQKR